MCEQIAVSKADVYLKILEMKSRPIYHEVVRIHHEIFGGGRQLLIVIFGNGTMVTDIDCGNNYCPKILVHVNERCEAPYIFFNDTLRCHELTINSSIQRTLTRYEDWKKKS